MDDVEDNLRADFDLSAWEVPPPAAGLADRVVRRAREPVPRAVATPRSLKPWVIGAGSLAALVAILALLLWGIERAPADGGGVVAATGPRTLDLGRSSAAIDSGAQLTWSRRGGSVAVSQSRGGATWRVSDEDTLVIDAAVASIEATGASLRVEVEMNRSDVRAMGVGSAAAVIVSLVTVIVYEGHVKATSNGQTVNIQPGASMQFGAQPPAPPPDPTPEQLNVGGTPEDDARIKELEAEVARLKLELAARDKKDASPKDAKDPKEDKVAPKPACDEVSCVLNNYDSTCCAKYKKACDPTPFIEKGDTYLMKGMEAAALQQFEAALKCKSELSTKKKAFIAACRSKQATKAQAYFLDLPADQRSNFTQICLRYGIALDENTCDADALRKKGDDYLANGMDTAALAQFEASLRCKYDSGVIKTAFLAACRSKQSAKAKLYYFKLPPGMAQNYAQICERFGIFLDGDSPTATSVGHLRIAARPAGTMIQIDGRDVGTAPVSQQLAPGKYKVTFVVGKNKYTFNAVIKAGEVTSMRKDFSADDP